MLWAKLCWESLGPALNVYVVWHVPPHKALLQTILYTLHGNGCNSDIFKQDKAPCHKAKMVQEWFERQRVDMASKLPWSQTSRASMGWSTGQRSSGFHASTRQGFIGCKRGILHNICQVFRVRRLNVVAVHPHNESGVYVSRNSDSEDDE